jgi:CheY-like chemotaxis protein
MMELESDFSALFAPEPAPTGLVAAVPCWQVLLVDDDVDIHAALRLSLQDMLVEGSAAVARRLFRGGGAGAAARNTEIALILLDVVMETSDAGLALVQHIRQEKRNRTVRIVLLTGQPGYSPQREIVMNYEIDDYRLKSDLSADKLFPACMPSCAPTRPCGCWRRSASSSSWPMSCGAPTPS